MSSVYMALAVGGVWWLRWRVAGEAEGQELLVVAADALLTLLLVNCNHRCRLHVLCGGGSGWGRMGRYGTWKAYAARDCIWRRWRHVDNSITAYHFVFSFSL